MRFSSILKFTFVILLLTPLATVTAGLQKNKSKNGAPGDGKLAIEASINGPCGITLDAEGNLFIAERQSRRIRRVDVVTGIITTVAGTGLEGFSGEGGPAILACLEYPEDVAVDSSGNLFIVDLIANRILRVDKITGILSSLNVALKTPEALEIDNTGNLFIADHSHHIIKVDAETGIDAVVVGKGYGDCIGDGGAAISACLSFPNGVAFDGQGNMFIADYQHNRIRRVDAVTNIITTIAGTGEDGSAGDGRLATKARVNHPSHLAVDSLGNVLFLEGAKGRVRRIDIQTGLISTVAGTGEKGFKGDGGLATKAMLNNPSGLAVDKFGNIFTADFASNRVRRIDVQTGIITTVAGNGLPRRNYVLL